MCGSVEEEKDDDDDECPLKPPPPQLPPGTVCPVCRDTMSCVEEVGALGCGHTFCFDCIHQWSGVTNHCCLCKTEFHYIDSWLQRLEDGEGGGGEGGATGGGCSSGRVIIPPPPVLPIQSAFRLSPAVRDRLWMRMAGLLENYSKKTRRGGRRGTT